MKIRSLLTNVLVGAVVFLCAAAAQADNRHPRVASISTNPAGQTYGRWAAEWWQWALGIPAAVNPLTDTTGAHCAQRQLDEVWFLAGSFSSDPVDRACDIPAGKSLFFPLVNIFYGAFLNDRPDTRTPEYVRSSGRCVEPVEINSVAIDGVAIPVPTRFFTGASGSQSPFFNVQLPPGNLFGLTEADAHELVVSPTAEEGYYLFVEPLPPGSHTIQWKASGCTTGFTQDITYRLTVVD